MSCVCVCVCVRVRVCVQTGNVSEPARVSRAATYVWQPQENGTLTELQQERLFENLEGFLESCLIFSQIFMGRDPHAKSQNNLQVCILRRCDLIFLPSKFSSILQCMFFLFSPGQWLHMSQRGMSASFDCVSSLS